ncbi:MAG: DUF169 domain-containing protein [Lachnospiraceae bacterium]|nr:DUF169 domain-containing protein [Lachnospiraceae bacterium]MBQ4309291.1 DUF169 domain-containing protein [Lachnospiraceae bacterium]
MSELRYDYSVFEKVGLEEEPIGVRYGFFRPDDVPPLEQDVKASICEIMRLSQKENRAFYFSDENTETCVGKVIMGMQDFGGFAESGHIGKELGVFEDHRCNHNYYHYVEKLRRGTCNYVSFAPLSKMPYEPDVLIVTAPPAQGEIIMRAMTYSTGELYKSVSSGVMGCSWFLAYPYNHQEVNFVIPRLIHGPHGRELYSDDTMIISIPYRWIPTVLHGLANMPIHLTGHESKEKYYAEFEGILADLGKKAENP